jgi:hypothetical protein
MPSSIPTFYLEAATCFGLYESSTMTTGCDPLNYRNEENKWMPLFKFSIAVRWRPIWSLAPGAIFLQTKGAISTHDPASFVQNSGCKLNTLFTSACGKKSTSEANQCNNFKMASVWTWTKVDCVEQRQKCSEVCLVIWTDPVISNLLSRGVIKRFMYHEVYVPFCTHRILKVMQEFRVWRCHESCCFALKLTDFSDRWFLCYFN